MGENIPIEALDFSALVKFARDEGVDLTFVGPEEPLVKGIVDRFQEEGLRILAPIRRRPGWKGARFIPNGL